MEEKKMNEDELKRADSAENASQPLGEEVTPPVEGTAVLQTDAELDQEAAAVTPDAVGVSGGPVAAEPPPEWSTTEPGMQETAEEPVIAEGQIVEPPLEAGNVAEEPLFSAERPAEEPVRGPAPEDERFWETPMGPAEPLISQDEKTAVAIAHGSYLALV
jgi:hypothetical protein